MQCNSLHEKRISVGLLFISTVRELSRVAATEGGRWQELHERASSAHHTPSLFLRDARMSSHLVSLRLENENKTKHEDKLGTFVNSHILNQSSSSQSSLLSQKEKKCHECSRWCTCHWMPRQVQIEIQTVQLNCTTHRQVIRRRIHRPASGRRQTCVACILSASLLVLIILAKAESKTRTHFLRMSMSKKVVPKSSFKSSTASSSSLTPRRASLLFLNSPAVDFNFSNGHRALLTASYLSTPNDQPRIKLKKAAWRLTVSNRFGSNQLGGWC